MIKPEAITLYNTLSGTKERFPTPQEKLKLFVCGPTPYDYLHIGNARTYIFFDTFARFLRYRNIPCFYLQNITDIDDKIIDRAEKEHTTPRAIARRFTKIYERNLKALSIRSVTHYAPATQFIPHIIAQIERLIKRGHAYEIPGDGWYFDLATFPDYGKLARRTTEEAEDGVSRIDASDKKRNRGDFCLWKFSGPHEPVWKAPFGNGRPGWHIEDTAISEHFFGPQYDIHGGGVDIKFPHHEAEIAEQESASGEKPFVRIWMHVGSLTVQGKKMSKSLGNYISIDDFLKRYSANVLRFLVLTHHYRSPLDYSEKLAEDAERALKNFEIFFAKLALLPKKPSEAGLEGILEQAEAHFRNALEDDVNTPEALATLFQVIHSFQERAWTLGKADGRRITAWIKGSLSILGIALTPSRIPIRIRRSVKKREFFRTHKQFIKADEVRKKIDALGYTIEDTPLGPLILKK